MRGCDAGVFAYGSYERIQEEGTIKWHGVKGLYLTEKWCERQQIIFENIPVSRCWHVDIWLADRVLRGEEQEFRLLTPLDGYGHRMSQTQGKGSRFGGAWLRGTSSTASEVKYGRRIVITVHTGAAQDKRYWLGRLLPDLRRAPSVPPRAAGASQLRMLPSGEGPAAASETPSCRLGGSGVCG